MKKIKILYKIAAMLIFPSCFILNTKAMDGMDENKTNIEKNTTSSKGQEKINKKMDEMVKKGTEKFKEKYEKTKENIKEINKKYLNAFKFKETDDFKTAYNEFSKQYKDFNEIFEEIKNSIEQSNDKEKNVNNCINSLFNYLKTEKEENKIKENKIEENKIKENKIKENKISEYIKANQLVSNDIHHRANALANYKFLNVLLYFIYKFYENNESTFGDITTEDINNLNSNARENNNKLNFLKNIIKYSYLNLDNIYNDAFDSAIKESGKDRDLFDKKEIIAEMKKETYIPTEEIDNIETFKLNLTKFLYYEINKLIVICLTNTTSRAIENFEKKYNDDEDNYTLNKIETEDVSNARKNDLFLNDLSGNGIEDVVLKQIKEYCNNLADLLNISNIENITSFIYDMYLMNVDILKNIYDDTLSKIANIGEENLKNYTENLVNAIINKYNSFQKEHNILNFTQKEINDMIYDDKPSKEPVKLIESTNQLKNLGSIIRQDISNEKISRILNKEKNKINYLDIDKNIDKEKLFKLLIKNKFLNKEFFDEKCSNYKFLNEKFLNYDIIYELLKDKDISKKYFNNKQLDITKICNLTNSKTNILTECLWLKFFICSLYNCYSNDHFMSRHTPVFDPSKYYETNKFGEKALPSNLNLPYMFLNKSYLNIEYEYENFFENIIKNMDSKDKEKYKYISKEDIINECYKKNKNNHFNEKIGKIYVKNLYREICLISLMYIYHELDQIMGKVNQFNETNENKLPENYLYDNFFKKIDIEETTTNNIVRNIFDNETLKTKYFSNFTNHIFLSDEVGEKKYALLLNFIKVINKEIYKYIFSNYKDFQKEIIKPIVDENKKILEKESLEKKEENEINAYNNDAFKDLSFFKIKNEFYNDENLNSFLNEKVENFENHPYYETANKLLTPKDESLESKEEQLRKIYYKISHENTWEKDINNHILLDNLGLIKFVLENEKEFNKDNNLDFTKNSCISNTVNNVLLECGLLKMHIHMLYSCYNKGLTFVKTSDFKCKDSRYWLDEEKLYDDKENEYNTPYYPISWQFPSQIRLHSNLKTKGILKLYLLNKLEHIDYIINKIMKNDATDKTFLKNFKERMKKIQDLDEKYTEVKEITKKEIDDEKKNEIYLANEIKKEKENISLKIADFLNGRQKTFDEFKDSTLENNKVTRNIGNIREEYLIYLYTEISKMFFVKIDHLLNTVIHCLNKYKENKDAMVNENVLLDNVFQKIKEDDFSKEIFDLLEKHRKNVYEKINFTKHDENGALFLRFIKTINRDIYKVLFKTYQFYKECVVKKLHKSNYTLNENLYEYVKQQYKKNSRIIDYNVIDSSLVYCPNENIDAFKDIDPTIFLEYTEKESTNIEDEEKYKKYDSEIFIEPQNSNIVCFNGQKFKLKNDYYFEENANNETINNILQQIENKNTEQTKEIKEFLKRDEEIKKHVEDLKNLENSERLIEYFNVDLYHRLNRDTIDKIVNDSPSKQKTIMHIISYLYKYAIKIINDFLKEQFSEEKQKDNYKKLNYLDIKNLHLIQVPEEIKEYFEKLNSKNFILNDIKYVIPIFNEIHNYDKNHNYGKYEGYDFIENHTFSGKRLDFQIKLDSFLSYPGMYFFMDIPLQILKLISQNPAYLKYKDFKNMLFYDQKEIENNIKTQLKEKQLELKEEQHKLNREQDKLSEEQLKEKQLELNLKEKQLKLDEEQLNEKIKQAEKNVEINKLRVLRDFLVGMWQVYEEAVPNMKNFNFLCEYYLYVPKNYFKDMLQNYYDYADDMKSFHSPHDYTEFIRRFFPYNILDLNFLHDYLYKKIFENSKKEEFDDFFKNYKKIEENISDAKEKSKKCTNSYTKKHYEIKDNEKFANIDKNIQQLQTTIEEIFLTNLKSRYDNKIFKDNEKLSEHLLSEQLDFANKIYLYKYIEENKIIIMAMIYKIDKHINLLKNYKESLSKYKKDTLNCFYKNPQRDLDYQKRFSDTICYQYNNEYFKTPNKEKLDFIWDGVLYSRIVENSASLPKKVIDILDKENYSNIKSYKKLCNMLSLYDKNEKIIKDYMKTYYKVETIFKSMPNMSYLFKKNDSIEKKLNTAEKFCLNYINDRLDYILSLKYILYIIYNIFPLRKGSPFLEKFKENGIFPNFIPKNEKEKSYDVPKDKNLSNEKFIDENSTRYDSEDSEDSENKDIKKVKIYITNIYGELLNKLENELRKFQIYTKINRNKTKIKKNYKGCGSLKNLHLDLNNEENINIVNDLANGIFRSSSYDPYDEIYNDTKHIGYINTTYSYYDDEIKKIKNLFSKANSYYKNKKDLTNCSNQINNLYLVTKKEALNRNLPLNDKIYNILLEYVNVLKTLGTNINKLTKNLNKSQTDITLSQFNIKKLVDKLFAVIFKKTILDFEKTFNLISKIMYGREYNLIKYFHDNDYKKIPFKEYKKYINYEDFEKYLDNLNIISNEKDKKIKILYNLITEEIENLKIKFIIYIFSQFYSQIDKKEAYKQIIEELSLILNIKYNKTMTYEEYEKKYGIKDKDKLEKKTVSFNLGSFNNENEYDKRNSEFDEYADEIINIDEIKNENTKNQLKNMFSSIIKVDKRVKPKNDENQNNQDDQYDNINRLINAMNDNMDNNNEEYDVLFTDDSDNDSDDENLDINNKKKDEYKEQKKFLKEFFNLDKDKIFNLNKDKK